MRNDLCVRCDGRGFYWKKFYLDTHDGKTTLADCYKQGATCMHCRGTGKRPTNALGIFITVVLALAFVAFVVSPVIHWLTS